MLPAPGQGAIAVQTRPDSAVLETLKTISDETAIAELVIILGMHGNADALEPLNELTKVATQRRFTGIATLCKESMRSIRARTAAAEGTTEEGTDADGG